MLSRAKPIRTSRDAASPKCLQRFSEEHVMKISVAPSICPGTHSYPSDRLPPGGSAGQYGPATLIAALLIGWAIRITRTKPSMVHVAMPTSS